MDEFVSNAMKSGLIQNLLDEKEDSEDEIPAKDVLEEEEECGRTMATTATWQRLGLISLAHWFVRVPLFWCCCRLH